MEMAVDTPELQAAARVYDDAAERTAALAGALSGEAAAVRGWCYGGAADAAERFFRTLAWAATTGGAELTQFAGRVRASADGYDLTELAVGGTYDPGAPRSAG
ncbi:hypothetical protein CLV92_1093 [Kineococcus xinjiangensis]|uniref:Uncharacterized protein n=1 Tax=Kineococcus xinjiangensis TaxID=512762 RepID=A0A2S6IHP3_9ACTN|nr:hypothetical protein [Kineococcus xinjiangensis]PPK93727.1 hypothetical protein CLV92_1093 [Kineococcus xinjiangensis]